MSKRIFTITLILVGIVLGVGVWYVAGRNQPWASQPGEQGVSQSNKKSPSDAAEEELDTTDWLTYRNEEYGFELKYPNILKQRGQENDRVYFADVDNRYTFHIETIHEGLDRNNIQGIFSKVQQNLIKDIKINNIQAYRFQEGDVGCGGYDYRFPLTGKRHLRLFFVSCGEPFKYEALILSSLKKNN